MVCQREGWTGVRVGVIFGVSEGGEKSVKSWGIIGIEGMS